MSKDGIDGLRILAMGLEGKIHTFRLTNVKN